MPQGAVVGTADVELLLWLHELLPAVLRLCASEHVEVAQ